MQEATKRTTLPPTNRVLTRRFLKKADMLIDFALGGKCPSIALVGHTLADADSIGTAYALQALFKDSIVAFQDSPPPYTRALIRELGLGNRNEDLFFLSSLSPAIGAVLCDTGSDYLGRFAQDREVYALVSHRKSVGVQRFALIRAIDPEAPSATIVAYEIIRRANAGVTPLTALALAAGLCCDVGNDIMRIDRNERAILDNLAGISMRTPREILELARPICIGGERAAVICAVEDAKISIWHKWKHASAEYAIAKTEKAELAPAIAAELLRKRDGNAIVEAALVFFDHSVNHNWTNAYIQVSRRASESLAYANTIAEGLAMGTEGCGGGGQTKAEASCRKGIEESIYIAERILQSIARRWSNE